MISLSLHPPYCSCRVISSLCLSSHLYSGERPDLFVCARISLGQKQDSNKRGVQLDPDVTAASVSLLFYFILFPTQISFSRGKKRYLFDFRFDLKWEAPDLECGLAKGVLLYPDVGSDCDGEYDVECQVKKSRLLCWCCWCLCCCLHIMTALTVAFLHGCVLFVVVLGP